MTKERAFQDLEFFAITYNISIKVYRKAQQYLDICIYRESDFFPVYSQVKDFFLIVFKDYEIHIDSSGTEKLVLIPRSLSEVENLFKTISAIVEDTPSKDVNIDMKSILESQYRYTYDGVEKLK